MKTSSAMINRVFTVAPVGMLIIDDSANIIAANKHAQMVLDIQKSKLIGSNWLAYLQNRDREKIQQCLQSHINEDAEINVQFNRHGHSKALTLKTSRLDKNFLLVLDDNEEQYDISQKLAEARQSWEDIFQAIGHPAMILDKNRIIQVVNLATLKATNLHKNQIIGKKCCEIFHGSESSPKSCPMGNMRLSGRMETMEIEVEVLNGTYVVSCTPVYDQNNKLEKIIHIAVDVTARKDAQDKLATERNLLRTLIDNLPDSIFFKDKESRFVIVNKELARRVGAQSIESLKGKTDLDVHPTNLAEKYMADDQQVMTTGLPIINQENPVLDQSCNKILLVLTTKIPLRNNKSEIIGLVGIGRNITDLRRAEQELKESEIRFRAIFENATDGILLIEAESRQVHTGNQKICDILKINRNAIQELQLDQVFSKAESLTSFRIEKSGSHWEAAEHQTTLTRHDGSTFYADVHVFDIQLSGKTYLVYTIRDVTEQKRLEDELFKTRKLESLGIFAGGIAHDFNNILTGIVSNLSLAKMECPPADEMFELLDEAEKAAFRATGLTQQLLTFSKGGAPIKKLTSLERLIRDTASFAISGSNVLCEFNLQDGLWHADVDDGQISQVINNLVINADQAMPAGGVIKITAKNVTLAENNKLALQPGLYVCISITDQGVGIIEEHIARIFDPYFTTKQRGSGLGLSTVYSIIKNHGGIVTVDSEVGKGTTFYVFLTANPAQSTEQPDINQQRISGSGKILVMDDELIVRKAAGKMLRRLGYTVDFAEDGRRAIEMYTQAQKCGKPFDVVIMDLTVAGGMGGEATIKKLMEFDANVKAIVSSGYSNDPIMADYKAYGFSGVVAKPFKIETLSNVLNKLISD